MLHKLKIFRQFADAIYNGEKTFEFRKDDRNFKVGDQIRFQAIELADGEICFIDHPINFALYDITYILDNKDSKWVFDKDFIIFSIKESTL